jgi:hypothetical protein
VSTAEAIRLIKVAEGRGLQQVCAQIKSEKRISTVHPKQEHAH